MLVVPALVLVSLAMAAQDGITLRKTLKTGTESYKMVSKSNQTVSLPGGAGDQELETKSTATYTFKIGAVDAAGAQAPVELTTKVDAFDMTGPLADMLQGQKDNVLKAITMNGTLDNLNRFIVDPKGKIDPMTIFSGAINNTIGGLFVEFPDTAVKIGDTWDVTIKKGPLTGKEDQKLKAVLVAEADVDGTPAYQIKVSGSIKTNMNMAELMKDGGGADQGGLAQMDMQITGTIEFKGEAMVAKATGQTLTMTRKMTTKQEMSVSGQSIPSTGTSTVTVTLNK